MMLTQMARRFTTVGARLSEALGLEVVRVKPHGANKARARLNRRPLRSGRSPLTFDGRPLPANRYFRVDVPASAGIVHLKSALTLAIKEALALNRVPVAFAPQLSAAHNFGKPVPASWERYVDLDDVLVTKNGATCHVRVAPPSALDGTESLSLLQVGGRHIVTDKENAAYNVIIKDNPGGLGSGNAFGHDDFDFKVILRPSSIVVGLASDVLRELGEYHALHVRRGDKLREARYPNLARDTSPQSIYETLARVIPRGGRIYILTDERTPGYFDILKKDYELFRYYDFPALRQLVEGDAPDNYLLYEIEQLLFDGAQTKIYTFAHPGGKPRLSLTTDVGWT